MTVHRRPPSDVGLAVPRAPIVRLPSGRSTRPAARPPTTGNARRYAEEPSMNTAAIRDKVAIVGMGCCKFGENWDQAPADMIVDAAYEAYADAGIDEPQRRIEAVFCGAQYPSKGTAEVADALKLYDRPVSMVVNYCATGTDAFRCGLSMPASSYASNAASTIMSCGSLSQFSPNLEQPMPTIATLSRMACGFMSTSTLRRALPVIVRRPARLVHLPEGQLDRHVELHLLRARVR